MRQVQFVPTKENLAFTLRTFAQAHAPSFDLDRGGSGWSDFKAALELRHRVTHPKKASDLEVSEADMTKVDAFVAWFSSELKKLMAAMGSRAEH